MLRIPWRGRGVADGCGCRKYFDRGHLTSWRAVASTSHHGNKEHEQHRDATGMLTEISHGAPYLFGTLWLPLLA